MQFKVEKLPKSTVKITVELTEDDMKQYAQKAAERLSQEVKIEGFRPGKASIEAVKTRVGETTFEAAIVDQALPASYAKAVMDEKLEVVSPPKVNIVAHKPLKFEAEVAVMPGVKLKDYTKIKVKKNEIKVEEKDVDEIMESLCRREATFKEVDRAAKKGDRVEMDFEGFDKEGKALPGTASKNHPVIIGDGMLIPGFEEGLIGLKKGDEKTLKLKFPKKYHAEKFQGKEVEFKVKVHKVEEREMPELNDEFAKKVSQGHAKDVAHLKEDIRKNLQDVREEDEQKRQESEFLEKIIELTEVELPDAMIEAEVDFMLERSRENMKARGMDFEKYMEEQKEKGKDLRKELGKQAEKQVALRLALREIYNKEDLKVTDSDVEAELAEMAKEYPPEYKEAVKQMYGKGSDNYRVLENKIRLDKVFKKYLK
ncbi:MAG: Trigger factor [uncultured bacterium]|nr:MAG: Trigger factor [uncultured bacterium]